VSAAVPTWRRRREGLGEQLPIVSASPGPGAQQVDRVGHGAQRGVDRADQAGRRSCRPARVLVLSRSIVSAAVPTWRRRREGLGEQLPIVSAAVLSRSIVSASPGPGGVHPL
jgi:hypothetical protein